MFIGCVPLFGFVDGNTIKADESLQAFEGCRGIITILDGGYSYQATENMVDSKRKAAAMEVSGVNFVYGVQLESPDKNGADQDTGGGFHE